MKLLKYLPAAAAIIISAGALCFSVYADESVGTTEAAETIYEETLPTAVSETMETTSAQTTVLTDVPQESETPQTSETSAVSNLTDGWNLINDRWFYYIDDAPASGIVEIDGDFYLFAPNGALKTGWQTVNSIRTYFDSETHSPVYGFISYMGNTYYNDSQLGKLTGMHEIDGNTYIFKDSGIMQTGFGKYLGYVYYCDENGVMLKGDNKQTPVDIDGTAYIISPSGKVHTGWQTVNGLRIYFDTETAEPVYGWINYQGKYFYADAETGKYTGIRYINDRPYRFDSSGVIQTGLQSFDDGKTYYYFEDGTWAADQMITVEKDVYYFDKDGYMTTGWQTINKNKYYFGSDGKMKTGWQTISKSKYYFGSDGKMKTGWQTISKNKYYFGSDGKMKTGWQTISKNKYYFGSDGKMKTGWQTISKNKYYFDSDGKMKTGWQTISKSKYYFDSDGKMKTGWQTISKNKYYFGKDGIMQTGFHIIDGKYCNLGKDGKLKPIKVFVGVGHGGYDPGAVGYIVEKEYTLKTAKVVEEYLKEAGIEYILSRDADIDTTMESKLELCNNYDPDLIIDIHFNAAGGHGFEVYHSMYGGMSKTLAENINAEVSEIMYSNGCKTFIRDGKDRFTIIRETHAPAVLIEGGYVDDWSDAQFIKNNYAKLAKAYAEGVLKTICLMFNGN